MSWRAILPTGICGAEMEDRGQAVPFDTREENLVANAGEKRRRDFALGRACAHAALAMAGAPDAAVLRDADGKPVWPAGFTGSITHTSGYAAAIAARAADFICVGIDAERIGGVTDALVPRLFDAQEREGLAMLDAGQRARRATILFSAKEAAFKAWADRVLGFASIHIEVSGDTLFAHQPGRTRLEGRFAVQGELALTVFWRR